MLHAKYADEQRVRYSRALREVSDFGAAAEDRVTALLAEGAALHLQADLRWLDLFEEQLAAEEPSSERLS